MIEFIETGATTYMRVQQAKDYFEKLYKTKADLYVRGWFWEKEQPEILVGATDWVKVDVESTCFLDRRTLTRYTFERQFDFRLRPKQRPLMDEDAVETLREMHQHV